MFTWTKWEVERRVQEELSEQHRKEWYEGSYQERREAEKRAREVEIASYEKADTFGGVKEGYVFKTGPVGLGYYRDVNSPDYIPDPPPEEAAAAAE